MGTNMNQIAMWLTRALCLLLLLPLGCKGCFDTFVKKSGDEYGLSRRITEGKLDNGITYYYLNNKNPKGRCYLRLNVAVGSFSEADDELGMAHMVEHLAFDDRLISKTEGLAEWFQKHGMSFGPDANAFTTAENTVYKLDLPRCDQETVRDGLLILKSFAENLQFSDEDIAKEKNIIDAEEREYNNTQGQLSLKLVENLYSGSSYVSRPVLGKAPVRATFTKEQLKSFYDRWYHPKHLGVVLVGDYGDLKPAELITEVFARVAQKSEKPQAVKLAHPDHKTPIFILNEPSIPYVEAIFTIQAKKLDQPKFTKALLKDRMAFDLALFMIKNTLKTQAKGKANSIRESTIDGFMSDKGVYELSLTTAAKEDAVEPTFMEAYLTLRQGAEHGFIKEDFLLSKATFIDAIDQAVVEQGTLGSDNWANKVINHINGKQLAYDAIDFQNLTLPLLAEVTGEDCQRALKAALSSGNHYFFAAGTIEDSSANQKRLKDLLKKAQTQKITRENAQEAVSFQYQVPDCPKDLKASSHRIEALSTTRIDFSNNVHIALKPTTFKSDEIILSLAFGDGYGVMSQRDYVLANMAQIVLVDGGLIKHPSEQVAALLLDKWLGMSLGVFERRIQASIATRNKDLRFALELARAYILDPLYDEKALSRAKEKISAFYAQLPHSIDAPLQHDFLRAMTNNDYRVGQPELAEFLSITREEMLAWHKKHLATSAINMVIVGDFELDQVSHDMACVFGTLPPRGLVAKSVAPKISFKPLVFKTYEVKTKDQASRVLVRYPLNFPHQFPDLRLSVIRDIIHEQLRLKLREKKQVVYDTKVSVIDGQDDFLQNWLDISLSVQKNRAKETKDKVISALDKLAKTGISEQALKKAKEPLLAQIPQSMTNNQYWADVLMGSFAVLDTMKWVVDLDKDIKKITIKDINTILRNYFHSKNVSAAVVNAVDG
jgi:zinc protease